MAATAHRAVPRHRSELRKSGSGARAENLPARDRQRQGEERRALRRFGEEAAAAEQDGEEHAHLRQVLAKRLIPDEAAEVLLRFDRITQHLSEAEDLIAGRRGSSRSVAR